MGIALIIIIIAAVIGGLLGFFSGDKDDKGGSAVAGAVSGAMGCGYLLFRLAIYGGVILLAIWLFETIFG